MTKTKNSVSMGFEAGFFAFYKSKGKLDTLERMEMSNLQNGNLILTWLWELNS